jgi:hypothetical protein
LKPNIHRFWVAIVFASCSLFFLVVQLSAHLVRLTLPSSMADVRALAEKAPLVFRGSVLEVIPTTPNPEPGARNQYIAKFQVDRWYRGEGPTEEILRFAYGGFATDEHNCIDFDFRPQSYWIVFAHEENGQLEMIDDCLGALTISPLLGRDLGTSDWQTQMEADFIAGLNDHDPAARLASVQRLGGLQLPSSRDALHGVIENGNDAESKWAVYAALRTGDISILPKVNQLLANGDREVPEMAIAMQLQSIADPGAVPDLIAILQSAPGETTQACAMIALGKVLKDPRAVPSLAAHLSDPVPSFGSTGSSAYHALNGLKNITHEEACTMPRGWGEQDVQAQVSRCKIWWEQVGRFRDWTQD